MHLLLKKYQLLLLLSMAVSFAFGQSNLNVNLLGHWDDDTLPVASPGNLNLQYSGTWGLAVNGHEFAVLGGAHHILFFDVTQPNQPQLVGKFAGTATTIWREIKSYKNRIYAVSDNTNEGLMIFDLRQAPNTITRTYWSNEFFNKSHTITLDTVSGRIYLNGTDAANQGLLVLDVSQNPDKPTLLANVDLQQYGGYIHDSYVRNDTIYASSGFEGYYVIDMKDVNNPQLIANTATGGYNHNSWLNKAGTYAYYTEEIPDGQPIKIVDLQKLAMNEIEVVGAFIDSLTPNGGPIRPVPHNVYIKDNLLFDSQYEDGLLVYDISIPTQPVLVAHYDTHPENTIYNRYYGNWGNYPWLPSGTIIAGDMQNGLYLLKLDLPVNTNDPGELGAVIFPNPVHTTLTVQLSVNAGPWSYRIFNPEGRLLANENNVGQSMTDIPVAGFSTGLYFLEVRNSNGASTVRKFIVE